MLEIGTILLSILADKGINKIITAFDADETSKEFERIVKNISSSYEKKYPEVFGGNIENYFCDEPIFSILFQMLFNEERIDVSKFDSLIDRNTLPSNFLENYIRDIKENIKKSKILSPIFMDKKIYFAVNFIRKDVENIRKSLVGEDLSKKIKDYKSSFEKQLETVHFFGLGISCSLTKMRKKITDIYVEPAFTEKEEEIHFENYDENHFVNKNFRNKRLSINDIKLLQFFPDVISSEELLEKDRIVILGNPGGGKSMFTKYISYKMCNRDDHRIPFRIELRKYHAECQVKKISILEYLINILRVENLLNIDISSLEKIFYDKDCIIFFDGLDEIFSIQDKIEVQNRIKIFADKFKNVKVVVTSRIIGYDEIKFDSKEYHTYEILDFDDDQINQYINNWYNGSTERSKEAEVKELITLLDTSMDKELYSNPLLLSLIVILFWNNKELPKSRLEVYESCTNTLIEKWEEAKEVKINLDNLVLKVRSVIFMNLAFWQYEKTSLKEEINHNKIINNVAETLVKLELAENYNKENIANDFLDYAKNRSIFFDDSFTHKTFSEYYTALYIDRKFQNEQELLELLKKYLGNPYWRIVFELVFLKKNSDAIDNSYLDNIFNGILKFNKIDFDFLLYILPKINFVKKSTVKSVIVKTIEKVMIDKMNVGPNLASLLRFQEEGINYYEQITSTYIESLKKYVSIENYGIIDLFSILFTSFYKDKNLITSELITVYEQIYDKLNLKRKLKCNNIFFDINKNIDFVEKELNKNTYKEFFNCDINYNLKYFLFSSLSYVDILYKNIFENGSAEIIQQQINKLQNIKSLTPRRIYKVLFNIRYINITDDTLEDLICDSNNTVLKNMCWIVLSNILINAKIPYYEKNQTSYDEICMQYKKCSKLNKGVNGKRLDKIIYIVSQFGDIGYKEIQKKIKEELEIN